MKQDEVKSSEFEWESMNSMVHVVRAQMSTKQYNELKGIAATSGKTLQQFVGDALCAVIRNHKKKGD